MFDTDVAMPEAPGNFGDERVDAPPPFIPTPERLSQFLEMNHEEVHSMLTSVEGRQQLLDKLMENGTPAVLREAHPDFDPELLPEQLEAIGEVLRQKDAYLEDVSNPEKQGLFRRAWEKVKGFAKDHPIVTTLLSLALGTAAVAGGFALAGQWELFLTSVGLDKIMGGAEAAGELVPPTPPTPLPPGAGEMGIPPPPGAPPGGSGPF